MLDLDDEGGGTMDDENDTRSSGGDDAEHARYRVLSHHGPGMMVSVHLRPEGWTGPDLYLLGPLAVVQERYPLHSVQVITITRAQRQRWRDAGRARTAPCS